MKLASHLLLLFKAFKFNPESLKATFLRDKPQVGEPKHYRIITVHPQKGKSYRRRQLVGKKWEEEIGRVPKRKMVIGKEKEMKAPSIGKRKFVESKVAEKAQIKISVALASKAEKDLIKTAIFKEKEAKTENERQRIKTEKIKIQTGIYEKSRRVQGNLYSRKEITEKDKDISSKATKAEIEALLPASARKVGEERWGSAVDYEPIKSKQLQFEYAFPNLTKEKIQELRTSTNPRELNNFAIANMPLLHHIVNKQMWVGLNKGKEEPDFSKAKEWKVLSLEDREDIVQSLALELTRQLKGKNSDGSWVYDIEKQKPEVDNQKDSADGTSNEFYGKKKFGLRVWKRLSGHFYDLFRGTVPGQVQTAKTAGQISLQQKITNIKSGRETEIGDLLEDMRSQEVIEGKFTREHIEKGIKTIDDILKKRIVSKGMGQSQIMKQLKPLINKQKKLEKQGKFDKKLVEKIKTLEGQSERVKKIKEPITQKHYDFSIGLLNQIMDVDNEGKILDKDGKRSFYKKDLAPQMTQLISRLNNRKDLTKMHGEISKQDMNYIKNKVLKSMVAQHLLNKNIQEKIKQVAVSMAMPQGMLIRKSHNFEELFKAERFEDLKVMTQLQALYDLFFTDMDELKEKRKLVIGGISK